MTAGTMNGDEDPWQHEVVILGAGFSKAVHEAFPTMAQLAARILPYLEAAPSTAALLAELRERTVSGTSSTGTADGDTPGFDFEAWLSRIAEAQPYLQQWENLERQALFVRASSAIREVLVEA